MTKTIMMFLAFLLVLPILPWLPLNISLKGKLIIAVESFAIAASAVLLASFLPVWQNALLVLLFCAMAGYFTLKYGLPKWSEEYPPEETESFEEEAAVMALPKKRPAFSISMPGRKPKQGVHNSEEENEKSEPVFFGEAAEKNAAAQLVADPPASKPEKASMSVEEKNLSFAADEEELAELSFEKPAAKEVQQETKQTDDLDLLWEEELPEVSFEQSNDEKANREKDAVSSLESLLEDDDVILSMPEEMNDKKVETDDYELELLFADEGSDDQLNTDSKQNEEMTGLSLYSAEEDSGENLISTVLKEDALAETAPEKTASAEESEPEINVGFEEVTDWDLKEEANAAETVQSKEKQTADLEDDGVLEELDLNWIDADDENPEKPLNELKLDFEALEALDLEASDLPLPATEEIELETKEISELHEVESIEEIEEGLNELDFSELAQPELASKPSDEEKLELKEVSEPETIESTEEIEDMLNELDFEEPELASNASHSEEVELKESSEPEAIESTEEIEDMLNELDFEEPELASNASHSEEVELKELSEPETIEDTEEIEDMLNELDFEEPELASNASHSEEVELKEVSEPEAIEGTEDIEDMLNELDFEEPELASNAPHSEEVELKELSEPEAIESMEEIEDMLNELDFDESEAKASQSEAAEEMELKELSEPNAGESTAEVEDMLNELDFKEPVNESSTEESVQFDLDEFVLEEAEKQKAVEEPALAPEENDSTNQKDLAEIGLEKLAAKEESNKPAFADAEDAEKEIEAAFEELAQLNLEELAFDEDSFEELNVPETMGVNVKEETTNDSKELAADEDAFESSEKLLKELSAEAAEKKEQTETFVELNEEEKSFFSAIKQELEEESNETSFIEIAAEENENLISAVLQEEALAADEKAGVPAAAQPPVEERARLSSEWLSLITEEITVKQAMLPFEEAEQTILRYLNAPLHERDYYVIARMLLVFYIGQGKKQQAELLAEELIKQFKEYPFLIEELKIVQSMLQN